MQATIGVWSPTLLEVKLHSVQTLSSVSTPQYTYVVKNIMSTIYIQSNQLAFHAVAKLVDLVNGLSGVNDWIPLGLNLGVEISTLKAIERERITIGERRVLMLNEWQKQVPPTWSAVIQALVKMGMRHLATQLAQKKGSVMPDGSQLGCHLSYFILQESLCPSQPRTRFWSNYT